MTIHVFTQCKLNERIFILFLLLFTRPLKVCVCVYGPKKCVNTDTLNYILYWLTKCVRIETQVFHGMMWNNWMTCLSTPIVCFPFTGHGHSYLTAKFMLRRTEIFYSHLITALLHLQQDLTLSSCQVQFVHSNFTHPYLIPLHIFSMTKNMQKSS